MTEETLGKRIVAHRKRLGLTQDALAEQLGVTAQAVSKWENEQSCPDISMLPKLAEIFGITIDALLGIERKTEEKLEETARAEPVTEESDKPAENPERRAAVGIALWLLLTGGILLAAEMAPLHSVGFWNVLGLTGLAVFGMFGLWPKFSLFRLGCGVLGVYYLYADLACPAVQLNRELLIPILLVLFGLGLLTDAVRGKKNPLGHKGGANENIFQYEGNQFFCRTAFGDGQRTVQLTRLDGGTADVTFGDLTVDIHDCQTLGEDCSIFLKCAFGNLTLLVPRRWRLVCANKTAFGNVNEYGSADPEAEGLIRLECDVSFGEISIKYI